MPDVKYNQEFETAYDVSKLAEKPAGGKASIEAFFTAKGKDVYAILPRWPGRQFTVKDAGSLRVKAVTLLGSSAPVRFKAAGGALTLQLPELPEALLGQPCWVVKVSQ